MTATTPIETAVDSQSRKAPGAQDRSIGAILIDAGRLAPEAAEAIMREQKAKQLRFGDAGIALGLLTQSDIDFALSRQFRFSYLQPGDSSISEEVIAAFRPQLPLVEHLRELRTQLMLRWFGDEPSRRALAIVGSRRGEGRSFIAANLAVVFSQLGERTLLIDANLRNPRQHDLFKISNRVGLSTVLAGRGTENTLFRVQHLADLTVLPAGPAAPNPQELLGRDAFASLLQAAANQFDVIIVDTPATSVAADAFVVASKTRAAALVVRRGLTLAKPTESLAASLAQSDVQLIGSIFNEA